MTAIRIALALGLLTTPALAWTPFNGASEEALAIQNLTNQLQFEGIMNRRHYQAPPPVIYYVPAPAPRQSCNEWLHHPTMQVDEKTAAWNRCRGVQ